MKERCGCEGTGSGASGGRLGVASGNLSFGSFGGGGLFESTIFASV